MFWDCNRKYFDNSLPTPYIELFDRPNIVARFEYQRNGKKTKKPIRYQVIYFSKTYEFDENTMRDVMVHEMIHYYTAWNQFTDSPSLSIVSQSLSIFDFNYLFTLIAFTFLISLFTESICLCRSSTCFLLLSKLTFSSSIISCEIPFSSSL